MNDNDRIIELARQGISHMERALDNPGELLDAKGKTDIKALKDYAATMKSLSELIRELKQEQMVIQPIEVILGEGERFGD